jgi:hypothetical protein
MIENLDWNLAMCARPWPGIGSGDDRFGGAGHGKEVIYFVCGGVQEGAVFYGFRLFGSGAVHEAGAAGFKAVRTQRPEDDFSVAVIGNAVAVRQDFAPEVGLVASIE